MFIINNKKIFLSISAVLILVSIVLISLFGLKRGIDFKGGSLMEVSYITDRPEISLIQESIKKLELGEVVAQESGDRDLIVRTKSLTEEERVKLLSSLSLGDTFEVAEKNYTSIGPSVGTELARKSIIAIFFVVLAIVLFIAYAFRKVSEPVASWKYGLIAIATLAHDILIPSALFAILGKYYGAEVDTLFVVAILTVLGLSVSDTIVVFDRIRENLRQKIGVTFSETVGL
jgi:preprotein translocase subunit SecF